MKNKNTKKTAFAMGGLAGNNAHGGGFLQAAMEKNEEPVIISCTSGQIFWVYNYLKIKKTTKNLEEIFKEEIKKASPTNNTNWDNWNLALFGRRDVYRPAYYEFQRDLCNNMVKSYQKVMHNPHETNYLDALCRVIPSRTLVPLFPDNFFDNISETFNMSDIGIVFNSYNPKNGTEYVHLNDKARKMLDVDYNGRGSYRDRTEYKRITQESVRQALWIYQYGFDRDRLAFDGAYFRQIMLSELVPADKIYVVRPVNYRWVGNLPECYIGVEDLKTETSFNGTYAGERDKIKLINKLIRDNCFTQKMVSGKNYHEIELVEIEIDTQEGFFDYINEKMSVFKNAKEKSLSYLL
ncbi:MAG: hypothetical protein GY795_47535 [Desulfobacterales bacterium]|nr:hypothetical protein [Desulfobacterales bacterium]